MFSPEDGMRTEKDFLFEAIARAIESWATEINLPDTVWFSQNLEIYELTKELINEFWEKADFSIHTHNDLWQAVANSLAFVKAWWTIVQWTIPPAYWERAWNADLIQIMMNIIKRPDYYWVKLSDKIDIKKVYQVVNYIANKIWKRIPENYPILWRDVYNHSSWIHQDWANKNKSTYEIIQPEEIGYKIEHSFILTNQSWRAWLENAIKSYFWIDLKNEKLNDIFEKFKEITSNWLESQVVTMDDIREILINSWIKLDRNITVWDYNIVLDKNNKAKASVKMNINWEEKYYLAEWVWAVDAIYKAIIQASWFEKIHLTDFSIQALTSDPSASAKVSITVELDWKTYEEFWVNQDIVKASIQAFTNCLDRIVK
jgi:2-isopropylmalate synthase